MRPAGAARVLVEKDALRPVTLTLKLTAADVGDLTVALTLSKWDEAPRIEVPPADQIE
ncbi:MAG: hypothetical protein HW391_1360 [Chloroflexi bacterium]|nr:hypothetical protein [Chloroflexota bacterium]